MKEREGMKRKMVAGRKREGKGRRERREKGGKEEREGRRGKDEENRDRFSNSGLRGLSQDSVPLHRHGPPCNVLFTLLYMATSYSHSESQAKPAWSSALT